MKKYYKKDNLVINTLDQTQENIQYKLKMLYNTLCANTI